VIEELGKESLEEFIEVVGVAFHDHPLLPADPSGKTASSLARAVLSAFARAPDAKLLGIRNSGQLECAAFIHDARYEPRGFSLLAFLWRLTRVAGLQVAMTFVKITSTKPQQPSKRLEFLLLGTRPGAQKGGLGRRMMRHVISFAQANGYESVVLEVAKETPAFGFYLSEGFEVEREIPLPQMPLCVLRRPLNPLSAE